MVWLGDEPLPASGPFTCGPTLYTQQLSDYRITLRAGQWYSLRVEMSTQSLGAVFALYWEAQNYGIVRAVAFTHSRLLHVSSLSFLHGCVRYCVALGCVLICAVGFLLFVAFLGFQRT